MTGRLTRENPARPGQLVGSVELTPPDQVGAIVQRADAAFRAWSGVPVAERAARLRAAIDAVEPDAEATAHLLASELGKVLADCRGELGFARAWTRWVADAAPRLLADTDTDDSQGRLVVERRPFGVVAAVTPWNAPVVLAMLKVAPALVAGNAVVVKPSPLAPLAIDRLLRGLAATLPDGVLSVVHGDADTGAALVGDPGVAKVAFTGGGGVARALGRLTADTLTPMVLELGGNDPAILLDDVLIDDSSVERMVFATYATTGQVCMAIKRLYVHASRYAELVDAFQRVADRVLVVGDPLADGTTVGPLVTRAAADRVEALVDAARRAGAEVRALGTVVDPGQFRDGYFVRPSMVLGLTDESPLVSQEQFGPVLPILPFDDEDEVIVRANHGELGLGASVWSASEERALALGRRVAAGFRFINTHNRSGLALRAPFGGVKRSGYGREYGEEGLLEYAQTCVLHAPAAFRDGGAGVSASAYPSG